MTFPNVQFWAKAGAYLLLCQRKVYNLDDEELACLYNGLKISWLHAIVERKVERFGEGINGLMDELGG